MEELQPERLYHYTTVESLALILQNKTLRLRALTEMDDLQEAQSDSIQNYGQFVFISSWTDDKTEYLPMWKMYSSMNSGVRISLPRDPFQICDYNTFQFRNPTIKDRELAKTHIEEYPIVDQMRMAGDYHGSLINPSLGHQLCQVQYVDESETEKLNPKVEMFTDDGVKLALEKMGVYKSIDWAFQREWRYRLALSPGFEISSQDNSWRDYPTKVMLEKIRNNKLTCPLNYLDLHLANDKLNQLEITTSPCISAGNLAIVKLLVKEYCPEAEIIPSRFENKVKLK